MADTNTERKSTSLEGQTNPTQGDKKEIWLDQTPEKAMPQGQMLSVVVPAYREAGTIEKSLHRLTSVLNRTGYRYEIILVSDGNTDGTPEIAESLNLPYTKVLHYEKNQGKGYALCHGVDNAQGDLIAFIDADLDIDPAGLERFLEILESTRVDAVVASKIHPDSIVDYPATRRIQSRIFRQLIRLIFNLEVSDTQTGLKLFRRELLDTCLPLVSTVGFAFDLELLVLANDASFRVVEGPLKIDYNFTSTTSFRAVVQMIGDVAYLQYKRVRSRHNGTWVSSGS